MTGVSRVSRWLLWLAVLACASASAQSWPAKPVKIVVPTSPGGATDTLARSLGARLSEAWHQSVIVENRAGANQIIGGEYVARAPADGYTLILSDASTYVINPFLYKKLSYDPLTSFAPVSMLVQVPWVVAVNSSVPANSIQELFDLARAKPGSLSYGSFGNGSSANICMDGLKRRLGIDIVHVPFKGSAPALSALLAGDISMMMVTPQVVEPHVHSGKLKLLAAATPQRLPLLPDLPTIAETIAPGYAAGTWFGLLAPAGTPVGVVDRISADVAAVMNDAAFRKQHITGQWLIPVADTPQHFAESMKADSERWKKLVEESGVSVE